MAFFCPTRQMVQFTLNSINSVCARPRKGIDGVDVPIHSFVTFALDGRELSASHSRRFTYVNSLLCVFRWMCIVTISRSGICWKRKNTFPSPRFEHQMFEPITELPYRLALIFCCADHAS